MAQDHELCRKKGKESNETAHGPPLQARVAAANGTVSQLANMLVRKMMSRSWRTWNGTGANKAK